MKFEVFVSREVNPDFFSRQIMKRLGTDYSHIGILVDDEHMFHSTKIGFHESSAKEFLKDHVFVGLKEVTPQKAGEFYAMGWLHGCIGTAYGLFQYGGFLLPFLAKFFKNGRDKLICSEAVTEFLEDCCGVEVEGEDDYCTPKTVWDTIK